MVHFRKISEQTLDDEYMHDKEHHGFHGLQRLSDVFHKYHNEDHDQVTDKKSTFSWLWVKHNPYSGLV
ncbi:hypothetical protein NDN08_002113 [Rhodosorus marinus]|uniref:Uncharacterized protein n=1 Tax=Rhodosorus marinus TaxID=101924 RepID=A0AAV8UX73_9RHOD|nr:hypothetical protein NDN08_002113 [Rhodosorus marinus]